MELSDWPDDLLPDGAPVATHNELQAELSAAQLWPALVRATAWPRFYANASDVRIIDGQELTAGAVFTWRTLGLPVRTVVTTFDPPHRLTWRGDTWYGRGCHTWSFEDRAGGCRLVTEEVQRGLVPSLAGWWIRRQLLHWHQRWLEGLVDEARRGAGGHEP